MASAESNNANPDSKEMKSLLCSLCLDVFEEAKLLGCGHTYCKKCLEKYEQCHPRQQPSERESTLCMLCPLCRQETNLGAEGVTGLPSNVSLNHLVEEFNESSNPLRKLYDDSRKCSQCLVKPLGHGDKTENQVSYAVVFCCDCDVYLWEQCLTAHKNFELTVFIGHQVVSVKEMLTGEQSSIDSKFDKCSEHTSEALDFYCADCRAVICHKCTIVKHNVRDHKIVERAEVEREIRMKITALVTQCANEKYNLEAFIRKVEHERKGAKASLEQVRQDIDHTFEYLQRQLEERKEKLKSEVEAIEVSCDTKFDSLKVGAQKICSQLSAAQDILESRDGHSCLEGDALVSHKHLLRELEDLLKTTQSWIRESQGMPVDVTRNAARSKFDFQPTDISKIGRVTGIPWKLFKEVELPHDEPMNGLTVLSPESILIGYNNQLADEFYFDGVRIPRKLDFGVQDVATLSDGRFVVTAKKGCLELVNLVPKRSSTTFKTLATESLMMLDNDEKDQIYVSYWNEKLIQVFTPDGGDPTREIKVTSTPQQVHATNCGRLVIRSNDGVRVLDENGKEITFIRGPDTFPAVDENDNLYIATIHKSESSVTIKRYTLDGAVVETILDDVKIKIPKRYWYYMKCPSPDAIALCTAGMMYVFKNIID